MIFRANLYWEASLPRAFRRPSEGDISGCKKFIEEKYRYEAYTQRACTV